jgi:hypothetical protein
MNNNITNFFNCAGDACTPAQTPAQKKVNQINKLATLCRLCRPYARVCTGACVRQQAGVRAPLRAHAKRLHTLHKEGNSLMRKEKFCAGVCAGVQAVPARSCGGPVQASGPRGCA